MAKLTHPLYSLNREMCFYPRLGFIQLLYDETSHRSELHHSFGYRGKGRARRRMPPWRSLKAVVSQRFSSPVARSLLTATLKSLRSMTTTKPEYALTLPATLRKEVRALSLIELRQVMRHLRYSERDVVLAALLTDMRVAEVCGLQWKHGSLSTVRKLSKRARCR